MWQEAFKSAKKGATFKNADFFSILREIVSHNLLNLTIYFIKVTLNIVLFVKTKMSLFHQIFFGFMSRMHKLQIFREKLQFSCIAFRLENPTQALPSRHWFHHHNSQCFFFLFQLSCHSSPQVMLLEHAWHLSQSFWWYDDDLRHHFSRHFRKWCQERGKNWGKSSKKENVWHQMVTQHQTSSL